MAVQLRGLGDLLLDCQCGAMVCARCKLWIEAQLIIGLQVIQRLPEIRLENHQKSSYELGGQTC